MSKFILLALCLLCCRIGANAQSVKLRKEITPEVQREIMELIKELFSVDGEVSYHISSKDIVRPFTALPDVDPFDEAYLNRRLALVRADSADYSTYYQLASYYSFYEKYAEASEYYRKAYDRLEKAAFGADSATFYSIRAVLRTGLSDQSAYEDFERALALNPSDSIAIGFYPMAVMGGGDFAKVRSLMIKGLDKGSTHRYLLYSLLIINELMEGVSQVVQNADTQTEAELFAKYKDVPYTKMFNYRTIDKYARRFAGDSAIIALRDLADVFGLFMKTAFQFKENKFNFHYTKEEHKRLQQLEYSLSSPDRTWLNAYARLKNLGLIKMMRGEVDSAVVLFEEAILVFPASKGDAFFNPGDSYNLLTLIYYFREDYKAQEEVLKRRVANKPERKPVQKDYLMLAKLALHDDRLREATYWVDRAREVGGDNFEVLTLMAHLYFLSGNLTMTQFYGEDAQNYLQSTDDQYTSLSQFALYQLWAGNPEAAWDNLQKARLVRENTDCDLCDKVEKEYLEIGPSPGK